MSDTSSFDVVVYGATGFTGRLVAEYLLRRGDDISWAIAGRNAAKLAAVAADLGAPDLPTVIADSSDPASIRAMVEHASVICTTVGPYAAYGEPLVAACAEAGTDYVDLTGEVQWIRRMIDTYSDLAIANGARIVHTCGFDSIPSDLGALFAQSQMHALHGVYASRVSCRVKALRGSASGGTIASLMNVLEEAAGDPAVADIVADPYSLNPPGERIGPHAPDLVSARMDDDFNNWIAPFVMATINTRVVRRSNALLGYPWGREFRYDEAMLMGGGLAGQVKATGMAMGSGMGQAALGVGPLRQLAGRVLPDPGEGPSPAAQEAGFFDYRLLAVHPDDRTKDVKVKVVGDRDPGYGSTSKMLAEAALCMAAGESTAAGGFWTPASAMGQPLIDRLRTHAGVSFDVL